MSGVLDILLASAVALCSFSVAWIGCAKQQEEPSAAEIPPRALVADEDVTPSGKRVRKAASDGNTPVQSRRSLRLSGEHVYDSLTLAWRETSESGSTAITRISSGQSGDMVVIEKRTPTRSHPSDYDFIDDMRVTASHRTTP